MKVSCVQTDRQMEGKKGKTEGKMEGEKRESWTERRRKKGRKEGKRERRKGTEGEGGKMQGMSSGDALEQVHSKQA
jgi:hypothetical protein